MGHICFWYTIHLVRSCRRWWIGRESFGLIEERIRWREAFSNYSWIHGCTWSGVAIFMGRGVEATFVVVVGRESQSLQCWNPGNLFHNSSRCFYVLNLLWFRYYYWYVQLLIYVSTSSVSQYLSVFVNIVNVCQSQVKKSKAESVWISYDYWYIYRYLVSIR